MSQVLVINSLKINHWASKEFSGGSSPLKRTGEFLDHFAHVPRVELVLSGQKGYFPSAERVEIADSQESLIDSFKTLFENYSQIIYLWGDTPLLDRTLSTELIAHHDRYLSQYTFSDGWPKGLTPEILEGSAIEKLVTLARNSNDPIDRDTLFTLIQKDINAFDLETVISPKDFRLLRLLLAADSRANWLLVDRFIEAGLTEGSVIAEKLEEKQPLLRTLPAFYQLQVTNRRIQKPSYLPQVDFTDGEDEIRVEEFQKILHAISPFSPGAVISLSYWGEPSCHSKIYDLMDRVLKEGFTLLIETSGLRWDHDRLLSLFQSHKEGKIEWIVELDALDKKLYQSLRGEGQEEVLRFIKFLGECKVNLYVQTTRTIKNEDHLESLYHEWKERPGELIIKKYDHFCKTLPSLKVTDLSPIKRNPCWHLKRDMVVLLDGSVLFCQEALSRSECVGNLLTENIDEIWKRGESPYLEHLGKDLPSRCLECDEYYTYNF